METKRVRGMELTAPQVIKLEIINDVLESMECGAGAKVDLRHALRRCSTGYAVEALYDRLEEFGEDAAQESAHEFRCYAGQPSGLDAPSCRHYESRQRAEEVRADDGLRTVWVGWTEWYGGGKHGDPGAVEWIEDAHFLEPPEKEVTTVLRFKEPCRAAKS